MDTDFCDAGFTHLLDDISEAFVLNDFLLWKKRILLPFSMITKDGPIILESQDELNGNFEQYIKACTLLNVYKIYRVPISLES